jgi:hypothetical protein
MDSHFTPVFAQPRQKVGRNTRRKLHRLADLARRERGALDKALSQESRRYARAGWSIEAALKGCRDA